MKMASYTWALVALLCVSVHADLYMHNPRGSNNRLNEANANRNNGDRLFDSQNNNRGGYNVGEATATTFNAGNRDNGQVAGGNNPFANSLDKDQYSLVYYEGSALALEWTAQHGCGGNEADAPNKLNCNMVIQYMCQTDNNVEQQLALQVNLKDGRNTNTPNTAANLAAANNQRAANDAAGNGRHESEAWYYECSQRDRNKGLFTADQNVADDDATNTRQNPNGNRRGLECAQERDYYPAAGGLGPTPFVDIAYLTSNKEDCTASIPGALDILGNTQNTNQVYKCTGATVAQQEAALNHNDQASCTAAGLQWKGYSHNVAAPECLQGQWSRVNQLGNGVAGQPLSYNWTVPGLADLPATVATLNAGNAGANAGATLAKCILRMRYNISTDDYDPRLTTAELNEDKKKGIVSPVEENPTVPSGANLQGLRLAINTAQFGRTFQDRSHVFYIRDKPPGTAANIINVNVRGKRGNIVQTFPSVEYDFVPGNPQLKKGDAVHLQWTGSNTHNNGNPAGDGQAGDAGEGTGGTDRHNLMPLLSAKDNYPVALDKAENLDKTYLAQFDCANAINGQRKEWQDCAIHLATSGLHQTLASINANGAEEVNETLDNAPASLQNGILLTAKATAPVGASFNFMGTRNNNFSNRSQKGTFTIVA